MCYYPSELFICNRESQLLTASGQFLLQHTPGNLFKFIQHDTPDNSDEWLHIYIKSSRTGKVTTWAYPVPLLYTEQDGWLFKPLPQTIRDVPVLHNWICYISNDVF